MTSHATRPEVWLRGPTPGIPVPLQPVAHAVLQALEDVEALLSDVQTLEDAGGLPSGEGRGDADRSVGREHAADDDLWTSPGGAATAGFHVRHMAGSLDRLLTYARGETLSDEQRAALAGETAHTPDATAEELLRLLRDVAGRALDQMRTTRIEELDDHRAVGRLGYPSSVRGLLYHAGEHTSRHAGQVITTVKIVRGMRRGGDFHDA
ncbi:hypothetical protein BH23GEM9_BH23GEM9_32060 [soil metagenome]